MRKIVRFLFDHAGEMMPVFAIFVWVIAVAIKTESVFLGFVYVLGGLAGIYVGAFIFLLFGGGLAIAAERAWSPVRRTFDSLRYWAYYGDES